MFSILCGRNCEKILRDAPGGMKRRQDRIFEGSRVENFLDLETISPGLPLSK
ncbi:hypothetical protein ACPOL_6692 [Acidisarcina polymorpha]|uniref:Uncharacterized protein n=1 Tax=Acidisarcina polymorpha TaxID=2211140 RepID=A0A2Z5GB07_9BACT|nr:hypothetical protein ACPOL_6692 [Acidisarcina polymorpha]